MKHVSALGMLLLALCGCDSGPKLTNLRCRQTPCQDPEDPFRLRLAVDFDDSSATLGAGVLELFTNGTLEDTVTLSDLFAAQRLSSSAKSGTLQIDEEVVLSQVNDGESFTAGLSVRDGVGQQSNTPELTLTLSLNGH